MRRGSLELTFAPIHLAALIFSVQVSSAVCRATETWLRRPHVFDLNINKNSLHRTKIVLSEQGAQSWTDLDQDGVVDRMTASFGNVQVVQKDVVEGKFQTIELSQTSRGVLSSLRYQMDPSKNVYRLVSISRQPSVFAFSEDSRLMCELRKSPEQELTMALSGVLQSLSADDLRRDRGLIGLVDARCGGDRAKVNDALAQVLLSTQSEPKQLYGCGLMSSTGHVDAVEASLTTFLAGLRDAQNPLRLSCTSGLPEGRVENVDVEGRKIRLSSSFVRNASVNEIAAKIFHASLHMGVLPVNGNTARAEEIVSQIEQRCVRGSSRPAPALIPLDAGRWSNSVPLPRQQPLKEAAQALLDRTSSSMDCRTQADRNDSQAWASCEEKIRTALSDLGKSLNELCQRQPFQGASRPDCEKEFADWNEQIETNVPLCLNDNPACIVRRIRNRQVGRDSAGVAPQPNANARGRAETLVAGRSPANRNRQQVPIEGPSVPNQASREGRSLITEGTPQVPSVPITAASAVMPASAEVATAPRFLPGVNGANPDVARAVARQSDGAIDRLRGWASTALNQMSPVSVAQASTGSRSDSLSQSSNLASRSLIQPAYRLVRQEGNYRIFESDGIEVKVGLGVDVPNFSLPGGSGSGAASATLASAGDRGDEIGRLTSGGVRMQTAPADPSGSLGASAQARGAAGGGGAGGGAGGGPGLASSGSLRAQASGAGGSGEDQLSPSQLLLRLRHAAIPVNLLRDESFAERLKQLDIQVQATINGQLKKFGYVENDPAPRVIWHLEQILRRSTTPGADL